MPVYTFENNEIPAEFNVQLGSVVAENGALRATSFGNPATFITMEHLAEGEVSVDVTPNSDKTPYHGIVIKGASDWRNSLHLINKPSDQRVRLISTVNGSTAEDLLDTNTTGISESATRTLKAVFRNGSVDCYVNSQFLGTVNSTLNDGNIYVGIRTGGTSATYDNFTVNGLPSAAVKTVTFALPDAIQGLSGVNYIITPNPLGDSITSGALDTSGTTITFNLNAFGSVSVGDNLLMIATDKQAADDNTDVIAWDASTVVEV
ncbi:hypothetical protein KUL150_11570 [Alteromonas sp. KUL150]|uniref:hypothetical protein n=1 Tax=Alteromonas sp. KUL150 TaxID=2480805 RepID=UPI0012E6A56F|nr:hypothetical protein [Alteromonas sp. KUL150]GFD85098.1 hypothetical protein KUL150_11570 [Alteromonas sp. KUL150]